jgi:hypothetical protein
VIFRSESQSPTRSGRSNGGGRVEDDRARGLQFAASVMATAPPPNQATDAGFSATELLIVATLCVTLAAITGGVFANATATIEGDADMRTVYGQLKFAREAAINQRRDVEVQFVPPNQVRVVRRNIPTGTTELSSAFLEHHASFMLFADLPDTPDGFGRANPVDFGAATATMFTADGMFTDPAGNTVNGTVFLAQPDNKLSARALTIFGPTAMIRTYRWNGAEWRK